MADATNDVEQLHAVLAMMAEAAATDPAYRETLQANQVDALRAAGVSAFALGGVLEELGADAEEVAAFGMEMGITGLAPGGPSEMTTDCIKTCRRGTVRLPCTKTLTS